MSDKVEKKPKNEWGWKDFVDDLYKKVIPKVYSRLAKLEAEVAKNRISVD